VRRLSTWLVVALAGGAFVAGCGSSSNSTTDSMSAALSPAAAAQAMARCKQLIVRSALSTEAKSRLEEICGLASGNNPAPVGECVELVHALHVPAGVAMERALAICRAP
jgi:hypothetical protein